MYVTTLFNGVVALDPETVPKDGASTRRSVCGAALPEGLINRDVVLSTDPGEEEGDACHSLIVRRRSTRASLPRRRNGGPCTNFSTGGQIDLIQGPYQSTQRIPGNLSAGAQEGPPAGWWPKPCSQVTPRLKPRAFLEAHA